MLDRDNRRRFPVMMKRYVRQQYRLPRIQRLTGTFQAIGHALAGWGGKVIRHIDLAREVGCCRKTVVRALKRFHEIGLLSWARRVLCCRSWRAQVANQYALLSPKPLSFYRLYSGDNLSQPGASKSQAAAPASAEAARASLAAIARQRDEQRRAAYAVRQGVLRLRSPA